MPFSFRPGRSVNCALVACLSLLGFFGLADSACAQVTTATTLSVTETNGTAVTTVATGTVVVLTASVTKSGGGNVTLGAVNFCDATAVHCEDGRLLGSSQLTSKGTAVLKFVPAPGEHTYMAQFLGTTANTASASSDSALTVTAGPFATSTSIAQSGSAGSYTLTATMTSTGEPSLLPSGPMNFLDTTNNNYVLGSTALTAATTTSSYAPFVGYNPGGTLGVIVADFNQDGIPDLLVWGEGSYVYGGTNFIGILLGKGDGTYQSVTGYNFNSNAYYPSAIAVGDLNGDGYPDVVVADGQTNQLYVLLNDGNGDGHLGWQFTYGFPTFSYNGSVQLPVGPVTGIAIGDVNGDGKPDVAITLAQYGDPTLPSHNYENESTFGVMLGNGNGSLQTASSAPWVTAYPSGFFAEAMPYTEPIELVDTRANGRLDVVVSDLNASGACVSLNNGDGTFASPTCYSAPAGQSVAVGDLNGDGFPDLVVSSWYSANGSPAILLGKGDGTFQNATSNLPSSDSSVALGDLNGDGKLDVVLGSNGSEPGESPGTISVSYGNGDGTFETAVNYGATVVGDSVAYVAIGDLNGDGVADIVAADGPATANVMLGSLSTSVTATLTGVSPVGASNTSHAVEASYPGDSYYSESTSATTSLAAQPVPTTLALGSNTSTVTVGGQVTLTATVTPGSAENYSASGTVTFSMNGNSIGTAGVSNGEATLKPHLDVAQTDSFTATYAGDSNFVGSSTTSAAQVMVQKVAPTLTVTTSPSSTMTYGNLVQVTAVLSPSSVTGGSTTDGEMVTFYNNGISLGTATLTAGAATFVIDEPTVASYSFTASYGGDASFDTATTSSATALTVQKSTSSMTLTSNPVNTTTYGQQIILSATFYPYTASSETTNGETITFYDNGVSVGTAMLNSLIATLRVNNASVGNHNFKVTYVDDGNFTSSTSAVSSVSVQTLPTTLTVSAPSSTTFTYGSPITVQVFLEPYNVSSGNTTNGEFVTLYQNGVSYGTAAVSGGIATFTVNVPPVGSNAYTASYAGDGSFSASTAVASYVSVQQATTGMGITTSAPHGIIGSGQPLTLTATIAPYAVTGGASTNGEPATFYENGVTLGTGTLSNGVATYTLPSGLALGNYSFTASYGGDTNFVGTSTGYPASLTVLQSTTLTMSVSPAHFAGLNQPVTLTATLSPSTAPGDNTNGQQVYFFNGSSQFGNGTLSNGVATYTPTNGLPQGNYSFTAVFDSDGILAGSDTSANPISFSVATIENYVVNFEWDDAGTAANCTPQSSTTSNTTDSNCSLRDALLAAAIAPEGANVTFDTSAFRGPASITLTNGTLTVPANTTLTGPTLNYGGTNITNIVTVDGGGNSNQTSSTVFAVTGAATSINNLIITGGWLPWNNGTPVNGGGILNSGSLTLTNSTVTNNGTIFSGGGVYNTGTLKLIGSTISGNMASVNGPGYGGGIDNENNGTLTAINSTIANNTAQDGQGAGVAVGSGTATFINSTISGNSGGGPGTGIYNVVGTGGGTVALGNTIVNGNGGITDIEGSYTDNGGNIVGYFNRNTVNGSNGLNLGPLDSYGGPTQTMLPQPGSLAICAGTIGNSPSQWQPQSIQIDTDQRGYENYNISYSQLPHSNLPSVCFDAGAVQTNYYQLQFYQSSYTGSAGGAVVPSIRLAVGENGSNRGAVPVMLSYSGPGTLSGNSATTVQGAGATFSSLSVDTVGSGTLSTSVIVAGTAQLSASTSLTVLTPLMISPASETFSTPTGTGFSQSFGISNGSGSYQLSNTGSLPAGLTLTPPGNATGTGWTLSGVPSQSGSYTFTLSATDVANNVLTTSQTYTVSVEPATTTTLTASPASSAPLGQTVTLTASVSSPTATGIVTFFDGSTALGTVNLSGGIPNTATIALNASTIGSALALGAHSFTAQYAGDPGDAASTSNALAYNVAAPNFVVNTISDDAGTYACTPLVSTTSNTTDGNSGGNAGLCTMRDALNTASTLGTGSIYFDSTVFAASNLAGNPAANTISANIAAYGSLTIPSNTTIQGLTSGSGVTLANLVTVDGGGSGVANNGTIFVTSATNAAINNLNINNGYASNGGSGGAIANTGSITISGSAFTGNQATFAGGAIYNAAGTVTIANSTFASNSSAGGYGGAIDNSDGYFGCGLIAVTNSTFSQNTSTSGGRGRGGAISNDPGGCILVISSTTMAGNSTDSLDEGSGAGIYNISQLYLANSIVTANMNGASNEDDVMDYNATTNYWNGSNVVNGNLIGVFAAYPQNGLNVGLAPLGNYGGATQTMAPLPGSSAICAGLQSAIVSGVTTDERGLANTNETYPGYSAGSPCVDSGAVQTNYAIGFSTEPPLYVYSGAEPINPAPVVSVTESGLAATFVGSPLAISDNASTLTGNTTANFSSGAAAFSNLLFTGAPGSDQLVATLSLNPSLGTPLSLTTRSTGFQVNAPAAAAIVSPAFGTTFTGASATFTWSSASGATGYFLLIGTQGVGSNNLYNSAEKPASTTSYTFPRMPLTGVTIYVRLFTNFNGAWVPNDYQYTAAGPAAITAPAAGATLPGSSATFTWSASSAATGYYLWIGTQGAGSNDLYNSALKNGTTYTFNKIPLNGQPIYVRLITDLNGTWLYNDYQYTAASPAAMISPAPGSVLPGPNVLFNWTNNSSNGGNVIGYFLRIGTQGVGSNDLYNSALKNGTTYTFNKMPVNGQPIYVRLITDIGGTWVNSDYQYTAGSPAAVTAPAPSGTLPGPTATFTWTAGGGATGYYLLIGTTSGGNDIYNSAEKPASDTSYTFTKLPTNGQPVYVQLITNFNGTWVHNDYQYTAGSPAAITAPAPSSTLPGPTATFTWTAGGGATGYYLLIGTTSGGNDICNSAEKPASTTSFTFTKLPTNGQPVYVRLITNFNGTWVHNDYQYTAN